jgi:hypothetical protein
MGKNLPVSYQPINSGDEWNSNKSPPNLCNLNSSWVDGGGTEGDVFYR